MEKILTVEIHYYVINLQNAVICSMDSSKDPSGRNSDFNLTGIQQILERKEGLFRRRMMGKRMNYDSRFVVYFA